MSDPINEIKPVGRETNSLDESLAKKLKSYRQSDPDFEKAIQKVAEAEVAHEDPIEGKFFDTREESEK